MHERFQADCVIFDLDGTLVDTAPDLTSALNYVLTATGREAVAPESVRSMVGRGARAMICHGLEATGGALPDAEVDDLFAQFLTFYRQHIADQSRVFPGVRRYLAKLQETGLPIGICTNKSEAMAVALLDTLELSVFFGAVLGGDSLAVKKPEPGHVTGTVGRLGPHLRRALFVGDSEVDLRAARNAGVPVVLVDFGYSDVAVESLEPDAIISSFEDLL